ncbi:kinesin-like protein KIF13A isoform X3 [Lepisosteus oculatus]|uniref:kinesin-like protein KIF13A isoform X3 n=1 Tax=Lepisosteus oculatus TaxID=7918 RepID=UPI0035F5127D
MKMSDSKVKVAVRVRPMNRREIELNTKCVVEMEDNQTVLHPPPSNSKGENRKPPKVFAFDYCFWSMDESNVTKYAGQEVVFKCLGEGILDNAFQGYNACIFAYGQTGSGKSFSMMGNGDQPGLIPRLCCSLFERVSEQDSESHTFKVEVSYMEIYNEKVRDLLDPKGSRQSLKVREHKVFGPYVDGLSQLAVTNFEDIESLMSEGNKSRTVAATNMNEESSRSHAVFSIIITQTLYDLQSGNSGEKVSKVSLVDLAGSERVSKTGAAGERLKEGSNINKSLTTLGCVISALADQSAGKGKNKFVPYRDSVLTWLLKDNLGGNSKTAMIATVSPAADNYEETLSTLRYADRAKRIVNHAIVNEDPNARIIRELREEVEKLREQLSQAESMKAPELKEKLEESEKLIKEMTVTWEEKLRKTEEIAQERQKQLESMGISLESSGIKVGEDKCFLVNLNADPALNELLVYYLKEYTRVGADTSQDIQLFGIGIQPEHSFIQIAADGDVTLTPIENARTCVNGTMIDSEVHLWHGDRILWGNNHFFRINLPKRKRRDRLKEIERESMKDSFSDHDVETASEASSEQDYNYEFAQMEVMMKTLSSNDPMQDVVQVLEKQYLEEKRTALEEQRLMYERELEQLRQQLSPERQRRSSTDRLAFATPTAQQKVKLWSEERDELFRQSLARLREQVVRANALVREANFLSEEMTKLTDYQVTLQIPAANLSANRKRGAIVSEPAIQVRRKGRGTQVWTIEKLENKLVDMRDQYRDWKEKAEEISSKQNNKRGDPFYEAQENHNLIGVANVFLECLFHDVKLQYAVPIISQQGEVAGRLHVELMRVSGAVPERLVGGDDSSENSSESGSYEIMDNHGEIVHMAKKLTCRVKIKEATGLPLNLSNFVFCQYTFWDQSEPTVAPPMVNPDKPSPKNKDVQFTVKFEHCKDYVVHVTEEFLEFMSEGALAIEVWGHRCAGNGRSLWELDAMQAKTRTLRDRWSEVSRRIEMWVSIQELNELGEYTAVELHQAKDVNTGGIFQLRQGHSRRLQVAVKPVQQSGTLPLIVEAILSVSIGCVSARSVRLQRALDSYQKEDDADMDSYQEEDLNCVRDRWSEALIKRREYLDEQIKKIINKQEKAEDDMEREARLVEQWVRLTEEQNAVLVPTPGSGIPGAPAHWTPSAGMEAHIPVLFLDLNADDLTVNEQLTGPHASGVNSILPKEHGSQFFYLPIIRHSNEEVLAVCSWDSSIHDSVHLNRITPPNERIYLIVKATVQLSHPAPMELVIRKRIAVNIYNKQSFTQSLKRRMSLKNVLYSCGVTYEIVSNIPKASEETEDRETLALMAARGESEGSADGETYIEKYTRGVLEVENILSLERLRQAVTVKEALSAKGRHIRRSISTPNVQHVSCGRSDLTEDDDFKGHSESHLDISDCLSSYQDISLYGTLPKDSPLKSKENHGCVPEAPLFFNASPFKALSPQPPKFLKSLMPVKEEHKVKHSLESRPLLGQESMPPSQDSSKLAHSPDSVVSSGCIASSMQLDHYNTQGAKIDSEEDDTDSDSVSKPGVGSHGLQSLQPYIPEEFADFDVYNASLESRDLFSSKSELTSCRVLEKEVSRSPTASSMTSGYFSHSASNATLSDVLFAGSDSTDQLANQNRDTESCDPSHLERRLSFSPDQLEHVEEAPQHAAKYSVETKSAFENESFACKEVAEPKSRTPSRTATIFSSCSLNCQDSRSASATQASDVVPDSSSNENALCLSSQEFTDFKGADDEKDIGQFIDEQCEEKGFLAGQKELDQISKCGAINQIHSPMQNGRQSLCAPVEALQSTQRMTDYMCLTNSSEELTAGVSVESGGDSTPPATDTSMNKNHMDSSSSDEGPPLRHSPEWMAPGEHVCIGNKTGTIHYVGAVDFAEGVWVGVELDLPAGKHDGTVHGREYFRCLPGHGVFVKPTRLSPAPHKVKAQDSVPRSQSAASTSRKRRGVATPPKTQEHRRSWVS